MCLAAAPTHEEGNRNNLRQRPHNSELLTRLLGELRSGVHQASGSLVFVFLSLGEQRHSRVSKVKVKSDLNYHSPARDLSHDLLTQVPGPMIH